MDVDLLAQEEDEIELKGSSIIAALKASAVEFILSVPDIVTSGGLLRPIARGGASARPCDRVVEPPSRANLATDFALLVDWAASIGARPCRCASAFAS